MAPPGRSGQARVRRVWPELDAFWERYDQWPSAQRKPRVCRSGGGQGLEGQLSSRTLRVSTCCWKATALPPSIVHTWAIFTTAGSPELFCFHP